MRPIHTIQSFGNSLSFEEFFKNVVLWLCGIATVDGSAISKTIVNMAAHAQIFRCSRLVSFGRCPFKNGMRIGLTSLWISLIQPVLHPMHTTRSFLDLWSPCLWSGPLAAVLSSIWPVSALMDVVRTKCVNPVEAVRNGRIHSAHICSLLMGKPLQNMQRRCGSGRFFVRFIVPGSS